MKKTLFSAVAALFVMTPALPAMADGTPIVITTPATATVKTIKTIVPTYTVDVAHYVTPGDTDFVVSSIINSSVKNNENETIGEVKDIVIRKNQLEGIVIGVGGFLGVGERYVVVDPATVHMSVVNGAWRISTNATKDSLKAAPEFKYEGRWAR